MDDQLDRKEKAELRVEHARRQGDEIHRRFEQWMTNVDELFQQVENGGRAKTRCFRGMCCNLVTRYMVDRKAVKAAQASNLLGINFLDVSYRLGPQRTASMYVNRMLMSIGLACTRWVVWVKPHL